MKCRINYFAMAFLLLVSTLAYGQGFQAKGNVISSEDQLPMIGASVVLKGSTNGTITDVDGNFSISVPKPGSVLVISYVGMATQEITVNSSKPIKVVLNPDSEVLADVVVTALGIKRSEKALGYSVQKVSGESLQKVPGVDVASSLTGKVAGLLVKNSSDFATIPDLSIRGEQPLLVIDGVAYANKTLTDIAAEDIESMSVLKGATASALYGYRGASGAILITTKNGSSNTEGINVDISTNTMFHAGYLAIPEKQNVYGRGNNNVYDINATNSWGAAMDGTIRTQWDPIAKEFRDYEYLPIGKDNFKNFLEQGYITNNNVNISYKGKVASLRSSFNWTENKGQYPNQVLDKFSYTFGGDINLDKFKLSSNLSYSKRYSPNMGSNGYTSYDPMYSLLLNSSSDYNILDYKNNYWLKEGEVQNWTYTDLVNNPYFDAYEKTNEISRDIFNADFTASYEVTKWLKATVRSGLDFFTDRGELRVSHGSYLQTGGTGVPGHDNTWNGLLTGAYITGQTQGWSINTDFLLNGEKEFKDFNLEYLLGGTIFYKEDKNIYGSTQGGLSVPGFFSLKASVNPATVEQATYGQQVNSVYGRLALSWKRFIFLEATGRNDWSSTLPKSTRSYFYPSISSSFIVSELLPESTKEWMDLLKVRGSWTMSKTPPAIYATNMDFTVNAPTWGSANGATAPSSLYPEDVKPESSSTYEIGLQGIFLGNRLSFDVAYYNKRMYDFIMNAPLSAASGYTGNFINTDEEITRRGWEITLGGTPIKTRDWQWDLNFNWSKYARYYTQLDPVYSSKKPWVKVGERVDALVSKDFVRDPEGNLVFSNGRLQYSAYDSNFGWTDPDWLWGLNTTLRYKNFSLFISMDGVVGGLMNTRTESYMWQTGIHPDSVTPERALDVANPGSANFIGQGVKVISGEVTYDVDGNILTDTRVFAPNDVPTTYKQYIIDLHNSSAWGGAGSPADTYSKTFFKIRELSLTYDVPTSFANKMKMKSASIGFVAQNLLLWAKDFKYSDPDGGVEDLADPSSRYLGFNLKVSF